MRGFFISSPEPLRPLSISGQAGIPTTGGYSCQCCVQVWTGRTGRCRVNSFRSDCAGQPTRGYGDIPLENGSGFPRLRWSAVTLVSAQWSGQQASSGTSAESEAAGSGTVRWVHEKETLLCCKCVGHECRVRTKSTCVPDGDLGGGFRVKASAKEDRESISPARRAESVGTNDRCRRRGRLR